MKDEQLIGLIKKRPGSTERELNARSKCEQRDLRAALMRCENAGAVKGRVVGNRFEFHVVASQSHETTTSNDLLD